MKKLLLLLLCVISCYATDAQDADVKAQALYMSAETAYNDGNYSKTVDKLTEAVQALGKSNAKIQYLLVKALIEQKQYNEAKAELNRYFEVATTQKGSEKYKEMIALLGDIDEMAQGAVLNKTLTLFIQDIKNVMASPTDNLYRYLHPSLQKYFTNEDNYKLAIAQTEDKLLEGLASQLKVSRKKLSLTTAEFKDTVIATVTNRKCTQSLVSIDYKYVINIQKSSPLVLRFKCYGVCEHLAGKANWTYFTYGGQPPMALLSIPKTEVDFIPNEGITIPEGGFQEETVH